MTLFLLGIVLKFIRFQCQKYKLPTQVNWKELGSEDIALVTGGSSGLGKEIVNVLLEKNVKKIYVLDIDECSTLEERVHYKKCDLGNEESCLKIIKTIIKELDDCNEHISVLVNNAGIRHNESLLNLTATKIRNIFEVNTFSQIWLIKEVLTNHLHNILPKVQDSQLSIVTVSSTLGSLAPKNLSVYAASKAAITQIHEALTREVSEYPTIRLLLVTPGQLSTKMFTDVQPSKTFLAPMVNHAKLACKIVARINRGEKGEMCLPFYANFLPMIRSLPILVQDLCRKFSEMDDKIKEY